MNALIRAHVLNVKMILLSIVSLQISKILFSGVSAATREEEAAGRPLLSAAGQRSSGEKVCNHPEGADSAGALSGGDQVGGATLRIVKIIENFVFSGVLPHFVFSVCVCVRCARSLERSLC